MAQPDDHAQNLGARERTQLRKNKLLAALPEQEFRQIQPYLEPFYFSQQHILHEPTEKLDFAYFPEEGLISLLVATEDGRTVEAGMIGSEGVAGIAAAVGLTMSPLRYVVQIPGAGFRIRASVLQGQICSGSTPQLQLILNRYAVIQGMQVAQTAACNRLHEIGQRLSRWLLMAADRIQSTSLPITHDFLASSLGTDRPSVSLAAKILQRKKIIQYRRGAMEIVNRKKLEAATCECYKVIQQFNDVLHLK